MIIQGAHQSLLSTLAEVSTDKENFSVTEDNLQRKDRPTPPSHFADPPAPPAPPSPTTPAQRPCRILGTDLTSNSIVAKNPRVTVGRLIGGLAHSRIIRAGLFTGAAVGTTAAFAIGPATAALGAAGTAVAAIVGTVAAAALVAIAANPLTYVALLAIGIAALAVAILSKKRCPRIIAAIVATVAIVAFVGIATNPVAWVVLTAVGLGALGLAIVCQLPCKGGQKMSLEISALKRIWLSLRRKSFDEIDLSQVTIKGRNSNSNAKIYLGPLPSRLTRDARYLSEKKNVKVILSFNERLEKKSRAFSHPYNQATLKADGIEKHLGIDAKDHNPVLINQLLDAADFIHQEFIDNDQSIYVHCLAGVGRSAMGIAAFLIMEGSTVDEAIDTIKDSRHCSTIKSPKKRKNLDAFAKLCKLLKPGIDHSLIREGITADEILAAPDIYALLKPKASEAKDDG